MSGTALFVSQYAFSDPSFSTDLVLLAVGVGLVWKLRLPLAKFVSPPPFRVSLANREEETCNWGCFDVRITWCLCSCSSNCPSRKKFELHGYRVGEYRNGGGFIYFV